MKQFFLIMLISVSGCLAFSQSTNTVDTVDNTIEKVLKEVVVKADLPQYRVSKGGVIIKVSGSPLSDAGTCFDLLAQMPGVRADEGNIEIIGKGTPQVYINGRRMLDGSELHRISSKEIQSVEILSNPGAKYGAGINSVVLIKTVRKQGDGLSGSLQASARQSHSLSQSDDIALNYRTGGIDLFGSFDLDYARRYQKQRNVTSIVTRSDSYLLDTDILILPKYLNLTGKLGVNWQINSNNSVGAKYEYSRPPYSRSDWHTAEKISLNGRYVEDMVFDTHWNRSSSPISSVNMYYLGKIKSFTINIYNDFYFQSSNSTQNIIEMSNQTGDKSIGSRNYIRNILWASKGTATYLWGRKELEFGYEFTSTDRKDRFENIGEILDDANDHIKESTLAGFVSANVPVDKVEFYSGLRYERTESDYYRYSVFVPGQSRKYSRIYPSFDFTFPISNARFTLSYAAKTKRPLYSQLSSAIQYDDRFTYETGNPYLVSEMRHDVTLAGIWRWIFFSANYQYNKHAIVSVIQPYTYDSPVNLMTYENIPLLTKYNIVLSFSPRINRWTPRLRFNLLGQDLDIPSMSGIRDMNVPVLFWNMYNSINMGKGFSMSADISGRTKGDMDVVTLLSSWQLNVGLTKNISGWFMQLQATDIFKTARNSMITYGEQMTLDKWNYSDTQALRLIVRYSFNSTMSKYKGKSAGQSEINRL